MSKLREAAQQALEALESYRNMMLAEAGCRFKEGEAAIAALRDALAQEARAPCDIAEDGVCEVIDCCRKLPLILEALEIGYASAEAEAAQYHAAMAGYRPERHAAMDADVAKIAAAITAVKAALAQEEQPTRAQQMRDAGYTRRPTLREMTEDEQEPVAWANKDDFGKFDMRVRSNCDYYHTEPLFAAPPRREWQGLTEEEIEDMSVNGTNSELRRRQFARDIEAALKEKNHG
jgi:hypothetical protein